MSKPKGYDLLFGGATHTWVCNCGKKFRSKDPREAREKYKEHRRTCNV